jgi:hypothetical protein
MTAALDTAPNTAEVAQGKLPTWRIIWRVLCFRKRLWFGNFIFMMLSMGAYQIPAFALCADAVPIGAPSSD